MSGWFTSNNKVFPGNSHSSTPPTKISKKPLQQGSPNCKQVFRELTAATHDDTRPKDVSCVEECNKKEKNDIIWKQCLKKLENKKGGKRKSKKYRNKKNNLTKRKRSYSSKKT